MRHFTGILLATFVCTLVLASCDPALDAQPQGELNEETFYNNAKDFRAGIFGAYSTLLNLYYQQFGDPWIKENMWPSDDFRPPVAGSFNLEQFNFQPTSGAFNTLWNQLYKGILRSNKVIQQLPDAQGLSESEKARFEGEARFLRGYFHFMLARKYGDAPIVDGVIESVSESDVGNSEPGAIWSFVEKDLRFAAENLPEEWGSENQGRATRYSALGMLGKVLLFDAQWNDDAKYDEAIDVFDQVVNSGQFRLMDDYRDNFRVATENNDESLFEVQMTRGDYNPWLPVDFSEEGSGFQGAAGSGRIIFTGAACYQNNCAPGANAYGYGQVAVTEPLQDAFEENDPRRWFTYYTEGAPYPSTEISDSQPWDTSWSITGHTPAKYVRSDMNFSRFPLNITTDNERILRYADVLLMLAEAELLANNNTSRAADLVNQVRERARNNYQEAYGDSASVPEDLLPPISASELTHEDIRHERRVELAGELHRYDDLARWHRAGLINIDEDIDFGGDRANSTWSEQYLLFPIPQEEIDNNENLEQNPGY